MKNSLLTRLVFLLFVFSLNISTSQAQSNKEILLGGKVLNSENKDEIPFANFIINDTRFGVIADEWGGYRVLIHSGDTLTITAIGYKDAIFVVPSQDKEDMYKDVLLIPTSYMLADVDVYTLGTWEQFKQDFVKLKIDETPAQKMSRELNKDIAESIKTQINTADCQYANMLNSAQPGVVGSVGFSTGFSFGSDKSQENKDRRVNLSKRSTKYRMIAYKYNTEIVAKIIGEHEINKVEHFMAYVNTHASITERTTQFQIIKLIKRLYANYIILLPEEKQIIQDTTV